MTPLMSMVLISLIAGTVAAGMMWLLWSLLENLLYSPPRPKSEPARDEE